MEPKKKKKKDDLWDEEIEDFDPDKDDDYSDNYY
jgi:hypothetical protein